MVNDVPESGLVRVPASTAPAFLFSNVTSSSIYGYGFLGSCGRAALEAAFSPYSRFNSSDIPR